MLSQKCLVVKAVGAYQDIRWPLQMTWARLLESSSRRGDWPCFTLGKAQVSIGSRLVGLRSRPVFSNMPCHTTPIQCSAHRCRVDVILELTSK